MLYEEDIERGVVEAVKLFGPMGKVLSSAKDIKYNIIIKTPKPREYVLWYGDLAEGELQKVDVLARHLKLKELVISSLHEE